MILPIGDTPNPRFTPWVNYSLIAANVLVFLVLLPLRSRHADLADPALDEYLRTLLQDGRVGRAQLAALAQQVTAYDLVVFSHGVRPAALEVADLFTAMFLHGGWSHLLGNMLFLWIYGDNVEHRLGRAGYLIFYLGTGVAAGLGDVALRWGLGVPSVGASGAISGVLGAYFLWFPRNRVRLFVFFFPFIMRTVEVGARWVLGAYVLLDNILPLVIGGGGGVSYGAHLGGFAAGFAVAWALRAGLPTQDDEPEWAARDWRPQRPSTGWQQPRRRGAGFGAAPEVVPPPLDPASELRTLLAGGAVQGASDHFFALRAPELQRLYPGDVLQLGLALEQAHAGRAAAAVHERLLSLWPQAPQANAARLGLARLLVTSFNRPTDAWHLVDDVLRRPHAPEDGDAARRLQHHIAAGLQRAPRR